MDSTTKPETNDIETTMDGANELDRRTALKRMMLGAIGVAASSSLTACLGNGSPESLNFSPSTVSGTGELGSLENPLTQLNPGAYESGKSLRQVGIFSSQVNASTVTPIHGLWVEVMDPSSASAILTAATNAFTGFADEDLHPMTQSEYVAEIRLVNKDTGSILAAASFSPGEAPRMLVEMSLDGLTTIEAYARIEGAGGWWKSEYAVAELSYTHDSTKYGSMRQPLTRNQSGFHVNKQHKIFGHTGSVKIKNQTNQGFDTTNTPDQAITRVIFGDHDAVRDHPNWSTSHYFVGAYLLDQRGQLITDAIYTWASGETGTTTDGFIPELKATDSIGDGAPGTGTSAATSGQEAAGVVFMDLALPDYVTEFRLVWLCNLDGWWHIRGNTALIAG